MRVSHTANAANIAMRSSCERHVGRELSEIVTPRWVAIAQPGIQDVRAASIISRCPRGREAWPARPAGRGARGGGDEGSYGDGRRGRATNPGLPKKKTTRIGANRGVH
jgi:hypothetical protein